jgi:tetratricopeptide (TPR) repeat protein
MAKPGRNDRCPCGSGKKYKVCCLPKDEARRAKEAAAQQTVRDVREAARRQELRAVREAIMTRLAVNDDVADNADDGEDLLMTASNAVVDLVRAGRLDEAEAAARDLIARYPDVHDGWDRLGMVHEARGETREAVACYRRVVAFLEQNPDYAEPAFKDALLARIAMLEPPQAG